MRLLILISFLCGGFNMFGQFNYFQYFDGADTSAINSVLFYKDSLDTNNIWQIGTPQKTIFSGASTVPNALVTDTINPYPANNTSTVYAKLELSGGWFGVWSYQWNQKIDFGPGDGGILEFSTDSVVWQNVFWSPFTYNFFGYDQNNAGIVFGDDGFVGTDTTWKNVWLCYDLSWLSLQENLFLRYTLMSDSTGGFATPNEGWLVDNVLSEPTWVHTVNEVQPDDYMTIFPNPANEKFNIVTEKKTEFHIIEDLSIFSIEGVLVKHFENVPTKFFVEVDDLPNGTYEVQVRTNFDEKKFKLVVQH